MKRTKKIFLAFLLASGGISCKTGKVGFRDSYLIYTQAETNDSTSFFANFFYAYLNDSVFLVNSAFGFKDTGYMTMDTLAKPYPEVKRILVPGTAEYPYKLQQRKDGVYCIVNYKNKSYAIRKYSYKINDTCFLDGEGSERDLKSRLAGFFHTVYLKDSIIRFQDKSIKCAKYLLFGGMPLLGETEDEVFVDKVTYLPVQINILNYVGDHRLKSQTKYVLRILLDKNEVHSSEFMYPGEFYEGR
ncbi:MAG: hypothetical protein JSS82_08875 [Bacteroidetes bacterium]|nr:hypothetical protein [Bacteroidota bacterium]